MKFFIDTANLKEIQEAADLGLVDGITTNPTLLSREGEDPLALIKKIWKKTQKEDQLKGVGYHSSRSG